MCACDIVIYTKKHIFDLHPHFGHQVPKTLGIRVSEVTFGKFSGSLRIGAGCQGKLRGWELSTSPSNLG